MLEQPKDTLYDTPHPQPKPGELCRRCGESERSTTHGHGHGDDWDHVFEPENRTEATFRDTDSVTDYLRAIAENPQAFTEDGKRRHLRYAADEITRLQAIKVRAEYAGSIAASDAVKSAVAYILEGPPLL